MRHARIRHAVFTLALALIAATGFAERARSEERAAVVTSVEIRGDKAILALSDDSTLEVRGSEIRVRARRDRERGGGESRAAARESRAAARNGRVRVLRATELKELVEAAGAQPLHLRLKYDESGRLSCVRGEIHASEAAAVAAMTRRATARAETQRLREAKAAAPAQPD